MRVRPLATALGARPGLCLALVLMVAAGGPAAANPAVAYGPVPTGIAGVAADERDDALAAMGLAALEQRGGDRELAVSLLRMLDDIGLKAAATRLARGDVPARAKGPLLQVVASSEHPEADVLLTRAAAEARPGLRMIAADGLGRGRSPAAVPTLARLALDDVPGVRIAALRSLFAIESPQAVAARMAVPPDREPDLLAARLRWHRRCEDVSPQLRTLAEAAYLSGRTVDLRTMAARYLAMPAADAPIDLLGKIMLETGGHSLARLLLRTAAGVPLRGYDAVEMRRIAIEAALTTLSRPDVPAARRTAVIDACLGWVARPVEMDPYSKEFIPEERLRRRLPDLGAEILQPVLRRLRRGDFGEPRQGVILIRELGAELALPVLRDLLTPRATRPPFESRTERLQQRFLRNAAAGALQELGQVGDETLARTLLFGNEADALKVDILYALAEEPGDFAVPLLAEVVAGADAELRDYAIQVLEQRGDAPARQVLIKDLFDRMERPHNRLPPIVRAGDETAFEVLERALEDERAYMRKAALDQFLERRNPALCGPAGRALLQDYEPDPRSPQELQGYLYALLNTDAARAVAYVRDGWGRFPTNGVRMTLLRILGEARGPARKAAVDLALEKTSGQVPAQMLISATQVFAGPRGAYDWKYRKEDVRKFFERLLFSDDVRLQREAIEAYSHPEAPHETERLLALLRKALDGKALPADASTQEGEQHFARLIINALRYHDWTRSEDILIGVATDPLNEGTTRAFTAQVLIGNLSEAGRTQLMEWLEYTKPPATEKPAAGAGDSSKPQRGEPAAGPGVNAAGLIQLLLAAAVGEGADATVAATLYAALRRELFAFYSPENLQRLLQEGPTALREARLDARVVAMARGIGQSRHAPTVEALLDLIFDLRFALYARVSVRRQAATMREAATAAAAIRPSPLAELAHRTPTSLHGMPDSVFRILYQVKVLDDETLARGMKRVLDAARAEGRLAQFPALYLNRVLENLLDRHSGRKPLTAAVVLRHVRRMDRLDSPVHFYLADQAMREFAEAGRFEEAARYQAHAVRVLARGNHDDRAPGYWLEKRAVQDALEGAAAAMRGDADLAEASFRRAVLRAPNDPAVLNSVAWYRALADFGVEQAEAEAKRATVLEARVDNRPRANAADTLAYVLLKRGRPREGLAVLRPRMREPLATKDGLMHLHLAQLYTGAAMYRSAYESLVQALTWDRALESAVRTDPWLAALREKVSIDEVAAAAAQRRLEEEMP